ncbi:hypothetical protein [Coralliovum pocilloporae]|uniref:hypothetical protein n=1 Tax=Coralliovum pocilloporae TaxID=3066369 RepID=UPI0033071B07
MHINPESSPPELLALDREIAPLGMVRLGAFCPGPDENAVPGQDAQPGTIVLVGNAGSAIWQPFNESRVLSDKDAMNHWTEAVLKPIAGRLGCDLVFPFGGPPWYPFVSWADRCTSIVKSPLGMGLHRQYGLFHAHRGAFLFSQRLPLPAEDAANPCDDCTEKPCLSVCPVSAFDGQSYAYDACKTHLRSGDVPCWSGCLARKACPVGRDYHYDPDHAAYHMTAFVRPDIE